MLETLLRARLIRVRGRDGLLTVTELRNTLAWSAAPPWLIYANACSAGMVGDGAASSYDGEVHGMAEACTGSSLWGKRFGDAGVQSGAAVAMTPGGGVVVGAAVAAVELVGNRAVDLAVWRQASHLCPRSGR